MRAQFKKLDNYIRNQVRETMKWESDEGLDSNQFPENITFERDGTLYISAETSYSALCVADYYGEYRGGYPWINPDIERTAEKLGLIIEWVNPGCLSVHEL